MHVSSLFLNLSDECLGILQGQISTEALGQAVARIVELARLSEGPLQGITYKREMFSNLSASMNHSLVRLIRNRRRATKN